jgi:predicted RND superfamily exporter protein
LYSFTANTRHGMPMSVADKKSSAKKMLEDIEWECWSDRQIGRHVGLSHPTVAAIRASMSTSAPEKVKFIKDGKEYEKKRVSERAIKPAPELKSVAEVTEEPEKHDPKDDAIKFLIEENDKLKDQLAAISGDESETTMTHISELREELKQAKIELAAVIKSRDSYQAENSQLKKQVSYMQRQIKKAA